MTSVPFPTSQQILNHLLTLSPTCTPDDHLTGFITLLTHKLKQLPTFEQVVNEIWIGHSDEKMNSDEMRETKFIFRKIIAYFVTHYGWLVEAEDFFHMTNHLMLENRFPTTRRDYMQWVIQSENPSFDEMEMNIAAQHPPPVTTAQATQELHKLQPSKYIAVEHKDKQQDCAMCQDEFKDGDDYVTLLPCQHISILVIPIA